MLALGVFREYFVCQHLGGLCEECFETAAELEEHFETAHFEFNRLNPFYRYICSKCHSSNSAIAASCQQCQAKGLIEVWVYGNFVRTLFFRRFLPPFHDPFKIEVSSRLPFLSSYDTPGKEFPFSPEPGDAPGFNGGMNHDGYGHYSLSAYGPSPSGDSDSFVRKRHSPPPMQHFDPISLHTSPRLGPLTLPSEPTVEIETDATFSEDETDWEDDGIPGMPEDTEIFARIYDILRSKDHKETESRIGPMLDPIKRAIVDHIMKDFWQVFDQQLSAALQKYAGTSCSAISSPSAKGSSSSASKSNENPNKRARENDDDQQPDEGSGDSHKRRNNYSSPKPTEETKNFACPYRKHNARRYNHHSLKWRTCALTPLKTVARVK